MASFKKISQLFLILNLIGFLLACSKLTQSNFDKIQQNMTMQEVTAILGEPASSQSVTIAGVSGTAAIWSDKNVEIEIQFLNGKVLVKTFNKVNEKTPAPAPREEIKVKT